MPEKDAESGQSAPAPEYEPDQLYTVKLTRPVEGPGGDWLSPAHENRLKGKYLAALGDAIEEAVPFNG